MSAPDYFFISDGKECHLPHRASVPLFDYMLPRMNAVAPDYSDQFEGEFYGGVLAITHLSEKEFMPVYHLIMQACDDVADLSVIKADLKSVLESDPRFEKAAA